MWLTRSIVYILAFLAFAALSPLAQAYQCDIEDLECEDDKVTWTGIECDGCNPCPFVFIYRQSADSNCPEAKHKIGEALWTDYGFTDLLADGSMCYTYTVEVRRNCTEQKPDGDPACSEAVSSCMTCPCYPK